MFALHVLFNSLGRVFPKQVTCQLPAGVGLQQLVTVDRGLAFSAPVALISYAAPQLSSVSLPFSETSFWTKLATCELAPSPALLGIFVTGLWLHEGGHQHQQLPAPWRRDSHHYRQKLRFVVRAEIASPPNFAQSFCLRRRFWSNCRRRWTGLRLAKVVPAPDCLQTLRPKTVLLVADA